MDGNGTSDVIVAAASGNHRTSLQFQAADPRTKGIGGVDASFLFWDDSPGSIVNCPPAYFGNECVSNFTQNASKKRQEIGCRRQSRCDKRSETGRKQNGA